MISEWSCDTEDWNNCGKKSDNILIFYKITVFTVFLNVSLLRHKRLTDPKLLNGSVSFFIIINTENVTAPITNH